MGYKNENVDAINKYYEKMGAGDRNFYLSSDVTLFKMKQGDNAIRILPALNPGEFFGEEIYVHEWAGMNKDSFLCLEKMGDDGDVCPFCEQAKALSKANAAVEDILPFKPRKRILLNVVDLNNEKDGTKVWIAPYTVVNEILLASYDRKAKTPRDITDPDEGHDIFITREGDGKTTKYRGIQMDPEHTAVDQSWLDSRTDLKSILIFPDVGDMANAIESMAGTVNVPEERTPSHRSRGVAKPIDTDTIPTTREKLPPIAGVVNEGEEIPMVDLKDQIAKATAGKYAGRRTRGA